MINDIFSLLGDLPWLHIVFGAVIAFLIGWVWYGVVFRDQYMKLMGKDKDEKDNGVAMGVQFIALLKLAGLVGIFSLVEDNVLFLVATLGLIGVIFWMSLAGFLFQRGNNKDALCVWGITAGYDIICVIVIFAIIKFV